MSFLNTPIKSIQVQVDAVAGLESMPWNNPINYPVIPPALPLPPEPRDFRWTVDMSVLDQTHSSYLTRNPGNYTAQDINVGLWIGNLTTGQAWQIISIISKTATTVSATVQDVYRYNTFRDSSQVGNGTPAVGNYVIFSVGDTGIPEIDPIPSAGASAAFAMNLLSRFEYINLQHDYPLYQNGNTFSTGDVIAVNQTTNEFVLSNANNRIVIGRVTSISDTIPGWFTINPVQKIVDFLDYLPGDVGDIIYSSLVNPGEITLVPGGSELYIKLRNNSSSITNSTLPGPTTSGNIFQINDIDIQVSGTGTSADVISAVNIKSAQTGVSASSELLPTVSSTSLSLFYGEPALFASSLPATATINGVTVTFNITSTVPGYEDYARAAEMAVSINNASISGIIATSPDVNTLTIVNSTGGAITIVNGTPDVNSVPFAGSNSGSGIVLSTPASTTYRIVFVSVDARPIDFLNVLGSTVDDFGLISAENGTKACGLYIEEGLRDASNTVVSTLLQLNSLNPLVGDQAYVIDSDDGNGNNVSEWSMWTFNGSVWVRTGSQDSASTDAKTIEYNLIHSSPASINIGKLSTGRRVTLITVEVITPFDGNSTLDIGYVVNNPSSPLTVSNGLMDSDLIELGIADTYTAGSTIVFGTNTVQGDVTVTLSFTTTGASTGNARVVVSYV